MIEKAIHFCWFGPEMDEGTRRRVSSWKRVCPDYRICEWNERNFPFERCRYAREAYECGKWAFVSDYARIAVLEEHGGVYLDTDVELLKPFDPLLDCGAFFGFEDGSAIATSTMASLPHHAAMKRILGEYDGRAFMRPDGSLDMTPNPLVITDALVSFGAMPNGSRQTVGDIEIYPRDYFVAKDYTTERVSVTGNTYAIHHFNASWMNGGRKRYEWRVKLLKRLVGRKNAKALLDALNIRAPVEYASADNGQLSVGDGEGRG